MRTIFAGWIAGYVMSISVTVSLAWIILKSDQRNQLGNFFDPDLDQRLLYVFLHLGASLLCTIVGLIIGALYHVAIVKRLGADPFAFGFFITLVIVVVVAMDTVSQVQTRIMSSQYESLIKKAKFSR